MTETLQIWLFGIVGAWCVSLTIAVGKLLVFQGQIKVILTFLSKKSAEILHSPDDHHGLDYFLDEYRKHHHDMSTNQWCELMDRCKAISDDPTARKDERLMAALFFIIELCLHKKERALPSQQPQPPKL